MTTSDANRPGTTNFPPLRIHHFLIWTALTAAIISGCMTFDRWMRNGPPIENRVVVAGLLLGAVAIAGALTVAGCGLYWRRLGVVFPNSPGECLLVIVAQSVAGICLALGGLLTLFFVFGDDDWFAAYYLLVGVAAVVAWFIAYAKVINERSNTLAWRVAFVSMMMTPFAVAIVPFMDQTVSLVIIAVIACVLWAAYVDWRKRIERNWTHWCGVACAISLGISLLCVSVPE